MAQPQTRRCLKIYFITTIPKPICNMEFKSQPFYRLVHKVIKPMPIYYVSPVERDSAQPRGTDLINIKTNIYNKIMFYEVGN